MPLTSEETAALVTEAAPIVTGAAVDAVHQPDEHTLVVTVHSRGQDKLFSLFSTRPGLSRFHLVQARPRALAEPPPFCQSVRAALAGATVMGLRQVSGDRVVEMSFALRSEDAGRAATTSLILEMMGGRGQLVLVGEGRKVMASLHALRRGGEDMKPGCLYRFPDARPQPPQMKAMAGTAWRYLGPSGAGDEAAPLNFAMARHYAALDEAAAIDERRSALSVALRREAARREAMAAKVREDVARAEAGEDLRRQGELLKGALQRLRRGMTSIEVDDYFEPEMPKVKVELDARLSPRENVERLFKRYQKSRRAIPILTHRLAQLEEEGRSAQELAEATSRASTLGDLDLLEARAKGLLQRRARTRKKGPATTMPSGPRKYTSADGYEILVGRSARENDELTLRVARGNDLFFHVAGRRGAHVIVRGIPGKPPPGETLLDAAQLALYYSLPERSRGAIGRGAAGEIDYALAKNVRKPRGAKPGLVLLAAHKTLRVRLEPDRLERLLRPEPGGEPN